MKISTRTKYGLQFMVYLGYRFGDGSIQLKEIAEHEGISEKYLEQIVPYLKAAGFVKTQRGASGGYSLKQHPESIALKDIIEPLEGDLSLMDDSRKKTKGEPRAQIVTDEIWKKMSTLINDYLSTISLNDLVLKYRKALGKKNGIMYYI